MLELHDFVESIRTPRPPRVNGEAGRDAVAVAERDPRLHSRRPIGREARRSDAGNFAAEPPLPAPHFDLSSIAAAPPLSHREAG